MKQRAHHPGQDPHRHVPRILTLAALLFASSHALAGGTTPKIPLFAEVDRDFGSQPSIQVLNDYGSTPVGAPMRLETSDQISYVSGCRNLPYLAKDQLYYVGETATVGVWQHLVITPLSFDKEARTVNVQVEWQGNDLPVLVAPWGQVKDECAVDAPVPVRFTASKRVSIVIGRETVIDLPQNLAPYFNRVNANQPFSDPAFAVMNRPVPIPPLTYHLRLSARMPTQ